MNRLSRDQTKAQTRKRLLESARIEFVANGIHAATVEAIAEKAGFSKGAVYSNFESKEAILLELVRAYLEEEEAGLAMVIAQHSDLTALLAAMHQLYCYLETRMDMCFLGVEFRLYAARNTVALAQLNNLFELHWQRLAEQFENMAIRGNLTLIIPAQELVAILAGVAQGLLLERAASQTVRSGLVADTVVRLLSLYFVAKEIKKLN